MPPWRDALDRRHRHLRGAPRSDRAAVLADIELAVGAEHAGVRRAGGVGEAGATLPSGADDGELAAVALDEDDAAVGHARVGPSGQPSPVGDEFGFAWLRSFDGSRGQAAHDVALHEKREDEDRDDRDHADRGGDVPVDRPLRADQRRGAERDRLDSRASR